MARVDERVVTLDTELANGSVVEIISDKNQHPRDYWLSFVKTTKARQNIRQYLLNKNRDLFIERGRSILSAYMSKNYGKKLEKNLSVLDELH